MSHWFSGELRRALAETYIREVERRLADAQRDAPRRWPRDRDRP